MKKRLEDVARMARALTPNPACEVKVAQDRRQTADLSCSLMSLEQVGAGRSQPEVCVSPAPSCFSLFFSIDF